MVAIQSENEIFRVIWTICLLWIPGVYWRTKEAIQYELPARREESDGLKQKSVHIDLPSGVTTDAFSDNLQDFRVR